MVHSALDGEASRRTMKDEHPTFQAEDGILDLDEPEATVSAVDFGPEPEWTGDELMQIDVKGNIWVRGDRFLSSRVVGRVGGEEGAAAIGMLVDFFKELEDRWTLLSKEVAGNHHLVRHGKSVRSFIRWVEGAKAIGDFETLLDKAHGELDRLEHQLRSSRDTKARLIETAEGLAESTAWRSTAETMAQLMDQWKGCGSGGADEDDALWERFKAARNRFFERRSEHSADMKNQRREGEELKEALITRAEALAGSTDWETTSDEMQALMAEWKAAPSAGRKKDEALWQRFHAARDPFFEARKKHFADQRRRGPRDDRRRTGGRPPRPSGRGGSSASPGARRASGQGGLHASLAELVGPLKDLFPADREDED